MKIHSRQNLIDEITRTFAEQEASGQKQQHEVSVEHLQDALEVGYGEDMKPKMDAFYQEHSWAHRYNFDHHTYVLSPTILNPS